MQEGEAGGITQQIGATYVPGEAIAARTDLLRKGKEFEMKMPGLLIIDTPGSDPCSIVIAIRMHVKPTGCCHIHLWRAASRRGGVLCGEQGTSPSPTCAHGDQGCVTLPSSWWTSCMAWSPRQLSPLGC